MSEIIGETFDNCPCSKFLLDIESQTIEMREQYIQQGFSEDGALIALLAFRLIESDFLDKAAPYFQLVTETHLDSQFTIPEEGERTREYPWLGEAAARNFLREVFFTLSDKNCGLSDNWLFFKHGVALATYWGHWRLFAHRNPDGFNYADLEIAKIKGLQSSSGGGHAKSEIEQPLLDIKYADWRRRAAELPPNMSKAKKAEIIEKAIRKESGETNSAARIRRII